MESMDWTAEQAMSALRIPESEQIQYVKITANTADRILAKTVLHQIMICPPNRGGRISINTNISSGSIKVRT